MSQHTSIRPTDPRDRDPDYDAVRSRAFDWLIKKNPRVTQRDVAEALEAGRGALRNDRRLGRAADPSDERCKCVRIRRDGEPQSGPLPECPVHGGAA